MKNLAKNELIQKIYQMTKDEKKGKNKLAISKGAK